MSSSADISPRQRRSMGLTGDTQQRELPTTARGIPTGNKLLEAATVVFERVEYLEVRLIHISTESGVSGDTQHRELPTTARVIRPRNKSLQAARVVFERDGYLDARLIDITTEAGVSAGSFYTYFDGKEEIFAAVLAEVGEEMLHPEV